MPGARLPALTRFPRQGGGLGPSIVALIVGLLLGWTALGADLDRGLGIWRANWHSRAATGRLAFVEIDARSLAELHRWPWPRGIYAEAIEALQRAGVQTIAFDVDFSSPSSPTEDKALAEAIARSTVPVVLPTFRQAASQSGTGLIENVPIASLREKAQIAAVNIYADHDGLVHSYPYGVVTDGMPRPSIGAMLANQVGRAGQAFPIDGAIDPATIPRVSFVDLIRGRASATQLRGRSVLIGASAIELGDRYPVPGRGVIPGPMIQLLAAETLLQSSAPIDRGFLLPLLIALATIVWASRGSTTRQAWSYPASLALLLLLPFTTEVLKLGSFDVVPGLAALLSGLVANVILTALRSAREARYTDDDTGLPNGRALQQRVTREPAAVVVALRLANYGDVASVLGQAQIAALVSRVADRMAMAADGEVYRIDDSALAWCLLSSDLDEQAQRIDAAAAVLRAPFEVAGRPVELAHHFGMARADGADAITKAASAADRAAARSVRWMLHTSDMERESEWRLGLAAELDQAMASGAIWVAYQPKLDVATRCVVAAEALVRWTHPERGVIPPDAFIPALEESGRIADLTLYVLERALADRCAWADRGVALDVAVNLSALLPSNAEFVNRLEAVLARFPDAVPHLTLEVTESATLIDQDRAIQALDRLAGLGIALSIDDYGTGQSTLSYLKRLPAREIKIDKGFVLALENNRADQAMVRSTIELAHELGFKVVAEGVETGTSLDILAKLGCDVAQGWHIGRPMSADDLFALPKQRLAEAA